MRREVRSFRNGWISEKFPNGLWPPLFRENVAIFSELHNDQHWICNKNFQIWNDLPPYFEVFPEIHDKKVQFLMQKIATKFFGSETSPPPFRNFSKNHPSSCGQPSLIWVSAKHCMLGCAVWGCNGQPVPQMAACRYYLTHPRWQWPTRPSQYTWGAFPKAATVLALVLVQRFSGMIKRCCHPHDKTSMSNYDSRCILQGDWYSWIIHRTNCILHFCFQKLACLSGSQLNPVWPNYSHYLAWRLNNGSGAHTPCTGC